MKLGVENRNTVIAAAVLGVIALFMVWRTFFSDAGPVIASNPPAATQPVPPANSGPPARRIIRGRGRTPAPKTEPTVTASLDPRLRLDLLNSTESTEYKGNGRNIFKAETEPVIPKPIVPPITAKDKPEPTGPVQPPPPPPPPPINIKFFGLLNRPGEPRQALLLQNDDVFVAKEGDVVNRRYRVVKINTNSVEIQDLLGNNSQTIPLTAG